MILLSTLNAKYSHAAMGLRYLYANMGELHEQTILCEYTINDDIPQIAEDILRHPGQIIGFGIYIWNIVETTQLIRILKAIRPELIVVLGGPEVSHDSQDEEICALADHIITGEADLCFAATCRKLLAGADVDKWIAAPQPDLATLALPYATYTEEDLAHRIIYVEASRGCPLTCEFCLSSLDQKVRNVPEERFFPAMQDLLDRGCKVFKFVDRTFNLSPKIACGIMNFFLDRWVDGLFLHFEMVPDRLPDAIKELLPRFPAGAVQFEIGIQSLTPEVGALISRRMNIEKTAENFRFIREFTGVHVHADLIIGLPGEDLESFAKSFDQLWFLQPGEIQVGILKLLKGTPIKRHQATYGLRFNKEPPYDILQSDAFPFLLMQRLKRFARYFEVFANSQRFERGLDLIVSSSGKGPFYALLDFSDWLFEATAQVHAFSLKRQYELCGTYLQRSLQVSEDEVTEVLAQDFLDSRSNPQASPKGLPNFLRQRVDAIRRERFTAQSN